MSDCIVLYLLNINYKDSLSLYLIPMLDALVDWTQSITGFLHHWTTGQFIAGGLPNKTLAFL